MKEFAQYNDYIRCTFHANPCASKIPSFRARELLIIPEHTH